MTSIYHVTKILPAGVFAHDIKHCDPTCTCYGPVHLDKVNPDDVQRGHVYEITDEGTVLAERACPEYEAECTCYEANGGHEPGCPMRPRTT